MNGTISHELSQEQEQDQVEALTDGVLRSQVLILLAICCTTLDDSTVGVLGKVLSYNSSIA